MTIILFLIDTSSSMCQKAYVNGVQKTYLDIAKGAVETFLKYRQRTQDCMGDRYMLLTFEEPSANVKAGWKENHATFMNELKNLQSTGLTSMGESLKNAFDLLNLNRMQSGIDTYGQGRCPFYLEPSVIIVITDGGRYSYRNGVHQEIILPLNTQIPGTKFTKEPFRWDQRLFSLVLRMSGNKIEERVEGKVPHDDSPIERMCEVTGGRSYRVRSHYVLNQCIESLVQKVQPGVVLQFEPMLPKDQMGQIPSEAMQQQDIVFPPIKKMIYVPKQSQKTFPIGYWPLPEPYWPDPKAVTLPPRDAHPKLKVVTMAVDEPQIPRNFPVDKYEVEASPLTLQILQKREQINKCWQVIISNGMHGFELPFGYLKASPPNYSQVHLYVLAYNYPALLPLLHDLIHKYNMSPPNDLMYKFNAYVRSIPPYYCPFLRKALLNINVPYPLLQFLLPENVDNYLSPNIANQLKHIKNTAKQDQENLCMKVYKQLKQPKPPYRQIETAKLNPGVPLRRDLVRHPLLRDTFAKMHAEIEPLENFTIVVPQLSRQASAKSYRNPFDIPRRDIVEEISRMRETLLRPTPTSLIAKDSGHCLPIAEMGNYQEYLKNKDIPLRELEPTNVRQHMFGNPYKKDKHMVMVDEADLGEVPPMKSNNGGAGPIVMNIIVGGMPKNGSRKRSRKAGPIRKDFIFRRTSIDIRPSSSNSSGISIPTSLLPSAANSIGSITDFEDDSSASETSSIASDTEDPDRSLAGFDLDEETSDQDFPLNGYVRNFINGNDESCENSEIITINQINSLASSSPLNVVGGSSSGILTAQNINLIAPMVIPNGGLTTHLQPLAGVATPSAPVAAATAHPYIPASGFGQPIILATDTSGNGLVGSLAVNPVITGNITPNQLQSSSIFTSQQINGNSAYSVNNNLSGLVVTSAATSQPAVAQVPATTPVPSVGTATPISATNNLSSHTMMHSDINDAQEISRILQQCHNGSSSPSFEASPNDVKMEYENNLMPPPPLFSTLSPSPSSMGVSNSFDSLKRENNHHHHYNHNHSQNSNTNSSSGTNHLSNHLNNQTNHKRKTNIHNNGTTTSSPLSDEQRDAARKHNMELRSQVFRDIRRPGRNYSQLLEHLNLVKGDYDMKLNFVQMCITESLRFRRKQMVNCIEAWWEDKKKHHHHHQQHQLQQSIVASS